MPALTKATRNGRAIAGQVCATGSLEGPVTQSA
jgi:hypothetical protein